MIAKLKLAGVRRIKSVTDVRIKSVIENTLFNL